MKRFQELLSSFDKCHEKKKIINLANNTVEKAGNCKFYASRKRNKEYVSTGEQGSEKKFNTVTLVSTKRRAKPTVSNSVRLFSIGNPI